MVKPEFIEGGLPSGGDFRIRYEVHGRGPDVVLLHGGGPGATGASNYAKNIAALAEWHRVWVIDFPGWGKSSKNLDAFGGEGPFQNGGRAVRAFMDAVGLERAHLVGNSFGGSAALCLAMDHPDRVARLVMMGPGGGVVPGATGPTEGIKQLLTYYLGEGPTRAKLQAFIGNLVHDASLLTPALVEERFLASNDPEICKNPPLVVPSRPPGKEMLISTDPRLAAVRHPALFVWGLQDRVNPSAGAASFEGIPNSDFFFLNQCGHWAQWEHPAKFNALVTSFLAWS